MIANRAGLPIRPGSMGQAGRGIEAGIVLDERDADPPPDKQGNLCLAPGWVSHVPDATSRQPRPTAGRSSGR